VHELGVDLLQHLLVERLLQDVLVLLPQAHGRRVHRTQRHAVCQLDQPPVLAVRLEDLEVVSLEEDYVGQVELERASAAQAEAVQYPLQPKGRLSAVGPEQVAVGWLSSLLAALAAQVASAVEVSRELSVTVDGVFEVADDEGVDFGGGGGGGEADAGLFAKTAAFHE
jgi:hypothetical protein